jgi:glyoxylase-like metal-dependent hydrolase (beta-lactamase superfamily II)
MTDAPKSSSATFTVLTAGYVEGGVASTVAYVRDGDRHVVIDPGMVASRARILDPLAAAGVGVEDVTDVVFSHHHPDHTLNAALFPNARFHDHWAIYQDDVWTRRDAEGYELSDSVRLVRTPGHTPEDITTLVGTGGGVVAFTHLWWNADGPPEDPLAVDPALIHPGRERVLAVAGLIVPGHGEQFEPGPSTPR